MSTLQPRSLHFTLAALAVSALALLLTAPQPLPPPPPAPVANTMMRPPMNPTAAVAFPLERFGNPPFGTMAYPGAYQGRPNPAGSMGYAPGMGGYGGGMAGYSYGSQYGSMQGTGSQKDKGETAPRLETSPQEKSLGQMLTASGVPNDGGRLRWPVALRVLGGTAADELRGQVDALFREAAEQTQAGSVNSHVAQELGRSVDALRAVLRRDRQERFSLALTSYEEAEGFLAKLDHAQKLLAAGLESPGGKVRLQAREGDSVEVGLYDNRFEPATLTVPAGTTVRWTNHGQHGHVVTSDQGDWGSSKELAPAGTYSYTFSRPGEYPYHCEVHPAEMRGTVVVK
jgi:plastocyanin